MSIFLQMYFNYLYKLYLYTETKHGHIAFYWTNEQHLIFVWHLRTVHTLHRALYHAITELEQATYM